MAGTVGVVIAFGSIWSQSQIDNDRAERALRAANLTFVRDKSSSDAFLARPFRKIDLAGQPLDGLQLGNAIFEHADLRGASLVATNLTRAKLGFADLGGANMLAAGLIEADLIEANLAGAKLHSVDFTDAKLPGADLRDADLRGANLANADLTGADLTGANLDFATGTSCWSEETIWPEGYLAPPSNPIGCNYGRGGGGNVFTPPEQGAEPTYGLP